jgi:hypothetical protein
MRRLLALFFAAAISPLAHADMPAAKWQAQMAAESIRSAILYLTAQGRNEGDEVSGLMIALGLLRSAEADRALVELSDYYLGESVGEDMNSVITHRGKPIVALLKAHLATASSCKELVRCLTREQRNDRLRLWIDEIEHGKQIDFNQ